ncbi:SsgA family sporulation/cell division regulator [Kitasatospora sp. NPDC094019]|uniref:SsgA family sporulation/cell division regulator n=1 Tax=Kitasatospora sp. NPDC094019 TaxID=3364091 RepID=UPI00381DB14A
MDNVSARVVMRLITDGTHSREFAVECHYSPDNPYAVRLEFGAAAHDAVWVLSRELLLRGLRGPAGEGDVHIEPGADDTLFVALRGQDGTALLDVPYGPLARFLTATEELVPAGREPAHLDWDRWLTELLSA